MWLRRVLLLAFLAVLGGIAYYLYCSYQVSAMRSRAYEALEGVQLVRGAHPLTASLVRRNVEEHLARIGLRVSDTDIRVQIEPLTDDNLRELSAAEQQAVRIARKMPHHEVRASLLRVRVAAVARSGPVTRRFEVRRTFLVKGPAVPTARPDEGEAEDGDD